MIGLRRHDKYVLKAFWASFGAVLVFFTVVTVIIHLADRGSRLVSQWERLKTEGYDPTGVLLEFYATLIPFTWIQLIPLGAVLASAFALSRLTRYNELAPLVTAGVSTRRITAPIVASAVLLSALLFTMQEQLVPTLSRRHLSLSRLLSKSEPDRISRVPHFHDPSGARLSMQAFQPLARRMEAAMLTLRRPAPDGRLKEILWYPLLAWDEEAGQWIAAADGRSFPVGEDPRGGLRRPIPAGEPAPLDADVRLVEVSILKNAALGLSAHEGKQLVLADPNNPRLLFFFHDLLARCLSPFVLVLLGLPFCLGLGRRSALPGTIAVLTGGAVYYATSILSSRFAATGDINPVFLAWAPTVLLGSIGLGLWWTMRS